MPRNDRRLPTAAAPARWRCLTHARLGALLAITGAAPAAAQGAGATPGPSDAWSWAALRAAPGVRANEVAWLERHVPTDEARALFATIGELSKPEAAQLLPSLAYLEGSIATSRLARAFADSLLRRPPEGTAGTVRVAYLLARARRELLDALRPSTYAAEFGPGALAVPRAPARPVPPGVVLRFSFDFAPAESLLAVVGTPDVRYEDALRRVSTPPFDALIVHHSQPFYPVALSREQLALNLTHAASTRPLERLYMYARPSGFYHFADVRRHGPEYRRAFDALRAREPEVAAYVSAVIAPYLPAGTRLERRVSFFFGDLSDGWAVGPVVAVPFEYYKHDYPRLLNTIVHETFHAAHNAVPRARPPRARRLATAADSALARAFDQLLAEGTANYVAPAVRRTPASADSMSTAGAGLLGELAAMRDTASAGRGAPADAQAVLNRGVAGAGPFYWLGAAMTRALVRRGGPGAVARVLGDDGVGFVLAYAAADPPAPLLPPAVVAAARAMAAR